MTCLILHPFFFRHGTVSHDSYNEDMYRTLLESYQQLQQEMASVAAEWQECEKRIDDYVDEQVYTSKTRQNINAFDTENNSTFIKSWYLMKDVTLLQLLFKVDGQSLTNQRTEPHKSLISKNVRDLKIISEHSKPFFYIIFKFQFL